MSLASAQPQQHFALIDVHVAVAVDGPQRPMGSSARAKIRHDEFSIVTSDPIVTQVSGDQSRRPRQCSATTTPSAIAESIELDDQARGYRSGEGIRVESIVRRPMEPIIDQPLRAPRLKP